MENMREKQKSAAMARPAQGGSRFPSMSWRELRTLGVEGGLNRVSKTIPETAPSPDFSNKFLLRGRVLTPPLTKEATFLRPFGPPKINPRAKSAGNELEAM
jgi:hypothetical protein